MLLAEAYWRVLSERLGSRTPTTLDTPTLDHISEVALWLSGGTPHRWLYLYGRIGSGKSTMAKAVVEAVRLYQARRKAQIDDIAWRMPDDPHERQAHRDRVMRARHMLDMVPEPHLISARDMAREVAAECAGGYERLRMAPCLVIDDVGTEPQEVRVYGSVYTPFEELIEARYNAGYVTIMTSNLAIDNGRSDGTSIASRYGERIADRFREEAERVPFVGKSYRS